MWGLGFRGITLVMENHKEQTMGNEMGNWGCVLVGLGFSLIREFS